MATRDHVRSFLVDLHQADLCVPSGLGAHLLAGPPAHETALSDWVIRVDGLRFGGGAVQMHRRRLADTPPPVIAGLTDDQALALCVVGLRAGPTPPPGRGDPTKYSSDLDLLLRQEPDFLDELLLASAALLGADDRFRQAVYAQAQAIEDDRAQLQEQALGVLDVSTGLRGSIRQWVGVGPDLSTGEWARWARALVVHAVLANKA